MHIASHFYFIPGQEERSFLLLGDGGRLEMSEFADFPNLLNDLDLLSLSSCDTGVGGVSAKDKTDTKDGREVESFAGIAQRLGAKSVIASLWRVSDAGTKELMVKFYQIRKEKPGLPKGEALRQAQIALMQGEYKTGERPAWRGPDVIDVQEERPVPYSRRIRKHHTPIRSIGRLSF